ncbi:MAG: L-2-amino-thiazoline-4-carboxylic acid hydrolase [Anaerolineaceae bacterium]|nr:L-2-amino-thiazoline-4-carboxylic acid hydrolase [Anaerolineaceae bacterium]
MKKEKHSKLPFIIGLVSGILLTINILQNNKKESHLPQENIIQKKLAQHVGEIKAAILTGQIRSRYLKLFEERPLFAHKALHSHLETFILPGIAMYQILEKELGNKDKALDWVDQIWEAVANLQKQRMQKMGQLPFIFELFKKLTPVVMKNSFPPEGWKSSFIDEGENTLAFDMHSCFYLDILKAYEVPELTPVYCRMDEVIYDDFSPYVSFYRTHTLAIGGDCCNFRFKKTSKG